MTESFEWEKHRLLATCGNSNTVDGGGEPGAAERAAITKYGRCFDTSSVCRQHRTSGVIHAETQDF